MSSGMQVIQPHDPHRFLRLADELGDGSSDETRLRTAVGRAYYGLFLLARAKTGAYSPTDSHRAVIDALKKTSGMQAVAGQLDRMRRLRTVADYEMVPINPRHQDWVKNWVTCKALYRNILPHMM